jgi:hypothetical protein
MIDDLLRGQRARVPSGVSVLYKHDLVAEAMCRATGRIYTEF